MESLILIILFLVLAERLSTKAEARRRDRQARESQRYYDAYSELIMSVRERQHDLDNHISAILGMIYTIDNYEELARRQSEYCHELMGRSEQTRLLLSVRHRLIAGFLYQRIEAAQRYHIRVEYHVAVDESEMKIPEYELIEILGVLFDNALEALRYSGDERKIICLKILDEGGGVRICLANTSKAYGPEEILAFFRKDFTKEPGGHGIGLKKLKKTVRALEGEIIVSNEKAGGLNFLQFDVLLPKKE